MRCPRCNGVAISYVSRTTEKETYRLYVCKRCSEIFGTLEVINSDVSENKSQYFKMKRSKEND